MAASAFLKSFDVQRVQLPDLAISYASAGTGPPVLLLHGHPQTHIVWRKIAPRLVEAGYQVIAPDLGGYGDSDKPKKRSRALAIFQAGHGRRPDRLDDAFGP